VSQAQDEGEAIARAVSQPTIPPGLPPIREELDPAKVPLDVDGRPFDPEIHQTTSRGAPVVRPAKGTAGRLMKRTGPKKRRGDQGARSTVYEPPEPGEQQEPGERPDQSETRSPGANSEAPERPTMAKERQIAEFAVGVLEQLGHAIGDPPGETVANPTDLQPLERYLLVEAGESYCREQGFTDLPPGLVLGIIGTGYIFRCFRTDHGQARFQTLRATVGGVSVQPVDRTPRDGEDLAGPPIR